MQHRPKGLVYTVVTLAAVGLVTAAQAATNCGLTGKWHYNGLLAFGGGQAVLDCTINIKSNGTYAIPAGQCGSWIVGQPADFGGGSGTIKANAQCKLSGVIKVPGRADTKIMGGFVNGKFAVLVGVRGNQNKPEQVRLVTLIKEK